MTETVIQTGFTQESFDAFMAGRTHEPDWLRDQRLAAWREFEQMSLPSSREEEWRRTDIRLLHLDRFTPPLGPAPEAIVPAPLLREGVDVGGVSVSLNSHSVESHLKPELADQGVLFGSLDDLIAEHESKVRPHLWRALERRPDKFAALHAACFSGGTLLYVPRGVVIEEPLHAMSCLSAGGVDLGHLLVVLEEGAEATLLNELASAEPGPALHCGGVELLLEPGSRLRYVGVQNWDGGVWHFAHQKAVVDRGASIQWTIGALGSRLAKVNQQVALVGENAEAQVNGVMFTEGKQHLSYHTYQHHEAPACHSDLLYKGALTEKSHIVWRGMIRVEPDAQKTDAYQRNDSLMLSDHARADSIPGLEIEADDVRCTHGATAGQVDEEQILYARTRGLTLDEATRVIVAGFFQQVFDRITIESVRQVLADSIGRRIRRYD